MRDLARVNAEMKLKLDESQSKMNKVRMKMEGKMQEKEFKVITLKN